MFLWRTGVLYYSHKLHMCVLSSIMQYNTIFCSLVFYCHHLLRYLIPFVAASGFAFSVISHLEYWISCFRFPKFLSVSLTVYLCVAAVLTLLRKKIQYFLLYSKGSQKMTFWSLWGRIRRACSEKHYIWIYHSFEKEKIYSFEKKNDVPFRPYV